MINAKGLGEKTQRRRYFHLSYPNTQSNSEDLGGVVYRIEKTIHNIVYTYIYIHTLLYVYIIYVYVQMYFYISLSLYIYICGEYSHFLLLHVIFYIGSGS